MSLQYLSLTSYFFHSFIILSTDLIKSFSVTRFLFYLIAITPANLTTASISAGDAPVSKRAINLVLTFSQAIYFNFIYNISSIPSKSGSPNSIFLSILPGRNKAGSKLFNLLVANIT